MWFLLEYIMINKDELKRQMQLIRCCRCGTRKERDKFPEKEPKYCWVYRCISCTNTPVGQLANQFKT